MCAAIHAVCVLKESGKLSTVYCVSEEHGHVKSAVRSVRPSSDSRRFERSGRRARFLRDMASLLWTCNVITVEATKLSIREMVAIKSFHIIG